MKLTYKECQEIAAGAFARGVLRRPQSLNHWSMDEAREQQIQISARLKDDYQTKNELSKSEPAAHARQAGGLGQGQS
jgi:hypothetical protein